ncbi:MAG TPA: hypothetical protein DCY88_03385 [Cyanobacteria bacterium UBA11372]|nr:hypothetical protein [Cyanobacteria bacterium UBA11372]
MTIELGIFTAFLKLNYACKTAWFIVRSSWLTIGIITNRLRAMTHSQSKAMSLEKKAYFRWIFANFF